MAIRPVDLQLAYMAAPANAAVLSAAQEGPQAAQAAAQTAFAAEVAQRQEHVDDLQKAGGQKVRARDEREAGDEWGNSDRRRRKHHGEYSEAQGGPLGLAGDGEHFIDVTA